MKRAGLALALLCGCSQSFQGSYLGMIKGVVMCPDQSLDPKPGTVEGTLTLAQVNNAISGFAFGCSFWGTVSKSTIEVSAVGGCDPSYSGVDGSPPTIQIPTALTGGTLTLSGSTLSVDLVGMEVGDDGSLNGCVVTFTGTTQKQPDQ